ncbi:MAG: FtsQ-type POTRA domain-containing protein [Acidobacteriota bacterium]|nr:FtsQ-type POTRA domain-containing protein [Acidobacteriota bacterium]
MNDPLRKVRKQRKPDARRRRPPKALPFLLAGAGLLAVLLLALGVRAVVLSATLRCHRIQVAGCQRLDESRLRDVASGQLGRPLLLIDLDRVRSEIEALPTVRRAIVARHFPDLLDLQIEERQAVARCRPGGGPPRLVDTEGYLFPPGAGQPGDQDLPRVRGLRTDAEAGRLVAEDRPALRALDALVRVTGRRIPSGTVIDLSPKDRIVLKPGDGSLVLWLDRQHPETNLEKLFTWKREVTRIAAGRSVDLRFPRRLTLIPAEQPEPRR